MTNLWILKSCLARPLPNIVGIKELRIARSGCICFGVNDIDPQNDTINNVEVCNRCTTRMADIKSKDIFILARPLKVK